MLTCMMLCFTTVFCYADDSGTAIVKTTSDTVSFEQSRELNLPYSDDWFTASSSAYNHALVQSSIGLANMVNHVKGIPFEIFDQNVRTYVENLGFDHGKSEEYNAVPTKDTIGSYISYKTIDDFTLIAVSVRGQGYKDEWMSNLLVGTGERHQGFNTAAQIIENRILSYINENQLSGKIKLWIAGFSRAAAVTNITSADLISSGRFDDVYAFCYACPRTTTKPVSYQGIYNICGAADVVPMMPFADWGFARYGTDYYLPTQEADSEYALKAVPAAEYAQQKLGFAFHNNVEVNHAMHTIGEYILSLCPTQKDYVEILQDRLIEAYALKGAGTNYDMVMKLLVSFESLNSDQRKIVNDLGDYLSVVSSSLLQGRTDQAITSDWRSDESLSQNLLLEHNSDKYISWLMSFSDQDSLYINNIAYTRFVVSSKDNITIDIYDNDGYVQSVDQNANIIYRDVENVLKRSSENVPVLFCTKMGTQTIIDIPEDTEYMFTLMSKNNSTIQYFGTRYDGDSLTGRTTDIRQLNMTAEEYYFVLSLPDRDEFLSGDSDAVFQAWDSSLPYSPSLVMHLENLNVFHLSFSQIKMLIIGNIVFLLSIIIFSTAAAIRRKLKRIKVHAGAAIAVHLVAAAVFVTMQQIANYYITAVPQIRTVFAGMASFSAFTLALGGYSFDHKKEDFYLTIDLLLCMFGDFLISIYLIAGSIFYLLGGLVFCYGFAKLHHPDRRQWILWCVLEIAAAGGLYLVKGELGIAACLYALLYYGLLLARLIIAFPINRWLRIVPMLYIVSDVIKGLTLKYGSTPACSLVINVVYYSGIMILAILTWYQGSLIGQGSVRSPQMLH